MLVVDAVASQDYPADRLRILVVDAGSRDATLELVRARAATDARIVPIESTDRLTTPQALNLALEHAEGELPVRQEWGGYRVEPHAWEFWQNRDNRLHDRFRYERQADGWSVERLAP